MDINEPGQKTATAKIFIGSPDEAVRHLQQLKPRPRHVIALTVEHPDSGVAQATATAIASLVPTILSAQKKALQQRFDALVELLVDPVPVPTRFLTHARMQLDARQAVFAEGDWLSAAEVGRLAGLSITSRQPRKWKQAGRIFVIRREGRDYFPAYGLNAQNGYRPVSALSEILRTFEGHKTAWQIACWFSSVNSLLGGKRPKDLLAIEPTRVMVAAKDELVRAIHG
ncbi:hypothetical protein [Chitiniphilus eburneus]|uniref:DUF2384 domain-containing protein n=1 Tax=Chitiniphilus eburneus TaxID=2571148 RepID=A0A4U0Q8F0_9NEIS|nr:hypothetical protein [Chitiniphilus eburneus]TJZ77537.1 hypothetical protein FAZ21_04200 [Chitiniphilus eburneus]